MAKKLATRSAKTSAKKKIKDLPGNINLEGVRFIYPRTGEKYYWFSQWEKGVWGKKSMDSGQIFPLFVDDLKETLQWEVVEDKT